MSAPPPPIQPIPECIVNGCYLPATHKMSLIYRMVDTGPIRSKEGMYCTLHFRDFCKEKAAELTRMLDIGRQ